MKKEKVFNKLHLSFVDCDQNCIFGHDYIDTEIKNLKELKEYLKASNRGRGLKRKIRPMYVDDKNGDAVAVGFVVSYKDKYDDSNETYDREDWIELRLALEVTRHRIEFFNLSEVKNLPGVKNEKSKRLSKKAR